MQHIREGAHGEGLRQTWHPFEQHMPAREQPDQQPFDHGLLADNPLLHFGHDSLHRKGHAFSSFMPIAR